MSGILLALPLFFVFEVWQLVMSERYLGVKTLASGADPRDLGLGEAVACGWSLTLLAYWLWMPLLLILPFARGPAAALLLVSLIGFSLRRNQPRKWTLIILTFEGGMRLVALAYLGIAAWRLA